MAQGRDTQTGSRIRARRLAQGARQAELAEAVGISASYLNLIEHNRRRIGGALLQRIAAALDVSAEVLQQGAEAQLIDRLREAAGQAEAESAGAAPPELDRLDDFTGRYPGWAALVATQSRRIAALEHGVTRLSDRMTHDPHLATALHDLLSTITSIRSTAAILAETGDITPEWRARFDRNIHEDSRRLSESSQSLVAYLDAGAEDAGDPALSPLEDVARLFEDESPAARLLEDGAAPREVLAEIAPELGPDAASLAETHLSQMQRDAAALPHSELAPLLETFGCDPAQLLTRVPCDAATLLRRLAALPREVTGVPLGFVRCDAAGAILARRALPDFPVPRYDVPCPLWPVFEALSAPGRPIQRDVETRGRDVQTFRTYSVAQPVAAAGFGQAARLEAVMLILPLAEAPPGPVPRVGPTCRICAAPACAARRVPSLLRAPAGQDG
ncbi:short-chain fatty acyl-CoA regulator family protein [Pseudaestuariivita sp.]|uniref:short-chain fatty acyl-CoA regulator family protein n=1 Tax=Pseudaestuariivita sp. TaxID=2211669 RepID=UPI00405996FC